MRFGGSLSSLVGCDRRVGSECPCHAVEEESCVDLKGVVVGLRVQCGGLLLRRHRVAGYYLLV
jgi:hypothetical protein